MADPHRRLAENVAGNFFVDSTCIDCDTCRQLAPDVFAEGAEFAYVQRQPETPSAVRMALQALVCCPTGSIGTQHNHETKQALEDFPLLIEEPVTYCGFTSRKSYGGSSYLVRHPAGNWLIDSPRFLPQLVRRLEQLGGVQHIFLTHADDVADADRYAEHFGATRYIHHEELDAQPDAEVVLQGWEPQTLAPGFVALPTPGHTTGHCVLLFEDRFLFTGDHLAFDRTHQRLMAFRDYCWHSWTEQVDSMQRLLAYRFEWILPGHGQRVHLPADKMRRLLEELVERMRLEGT